MLRNSITIALIFASLWPLKVHSQEIPFLGGDADGRTVLSLEHQTDSAPSTSPGFFVEEQKAFFAVPLYNDQKGSTLSFLFRGTRTLLGEKLVFMDRNVETPEEFGTAEVGFTWLKKTSDGNSRGFSATYGSAGRRILDSGLTPIISATFTAENKSSENRSWLFFLNYSNNRVILNHIPIPGVAYVIKEPKHMIIIGVPFVFAMWRSDPIILSAATSPFFVSGEAAYRFWGPLLIYGNAKWRPKAYQNLVKDREDRLIFDRKETALGLRTYFGKYGNLSIGYVWNFDRRFMLGRSITDSNSETISLDGSSGIQLSGRLNF